MPDYIPQREADTLLFLNNLSAQVSAQYADYGVTASLANALAEQVADFAAARAVTQDGMTRSPGNIILKDQKKRLAIQTARAAVRIIQSHPGTTDAMRATLNITIRKPRPTPGSAPDLTPQVSVAKVRGHAVTVNVRDPDSASTRRKAAGMIGAFIYYCVGLDYPADESAWTFGGLATRHEHTLNLPRTLPAGTPVWITAAWVTPTGHPGPRARPVPAHTQYAGAIITTPIVPQKLAA
jgi:hypothetical protein